MRQKNKFFVFIKKEQETKNKKEIELLPKRKITVIKVIFLMVTILIYLFDNDPS